jgi:hypothetical protein
MEHLQRQLDDAERQNRENESLLAGVRAQLVDKEAQIVAGYEQFKKYMEKARTVCGHIWIERHLKLNNYLYR